MTLIRLRIQSPTASGIFYPYGESYIISLRTHRALFENEPTVGNCLCGEMDAVLNIPNDRLRRNAKMFLEIRDENDEDWTPHGTYYIYSRSVDHDSGLVSIVAYDCIFRAEEAFVQPGNIGTWPRLDKTVMNQIASRTGTTVDPDSFDRMNKGYMIQFPGITIEGDGGSVSYEVTGTTMRELAGFIASAYAGNWIIDNDGCWRLIVMGDVPAVTNYLVTELAEPILIGGVRILV